MTVRTATALALLTLTAACANAGAGPVGTPQPIERESISYSTAPCHGFCPVYKVKVTPEGQGVFEGQNHTAVTGERSFTIDPATYRRFAQHLAAIRPQGERRIEMESANCGVAPTDMPGIEVRWSTDTGGADDTLSLYLGCRSDEAQRVAGVLKSAPDLLPIAAFIGKR